MRNNFSSDDHDPGDEDPTECVKRALLEVLGDEPLIREVPPRHLMSQTQVTPLFDVPFTQSPWPWLV